jgi:hypothetical protein
LQRFRHAEARVSPEITWAAGLAIGVSLGIPVGLLIDRLIDWVTADVRRS